jgi:hypothetical protein
MTDKKIFVDFDRRADEIRGIAKGIFDPEERAALLLFVADFEKMAAEWAAKP